MFPLDPNEPGFITWMRNPKVRRTLVLGTLWIFIFAILVRFRAVLLPFGLAVLLAFILEPLVNWLSKKEIRGWKIPRSVSIISIYVALIAFFSVFGTWSLAQIGRELAGVTKVSTTFVADAKAVSEQILDRAEQFAKTNNIQIDRAEIEAVVQQNVVSAAEAFSRNAKSVFTLGRDIVGGTFTVIFGLFLVLMLTAFLSMDRRKIERFFFSLVPGEYQRGYVTILQGMSLGLAGVVRGQVLICLTNGVLSFIGLWILGVKLPLILATLATAFSLIPIFGSIISTIPIVAMALTDSITKGILALLWIIGIHLVEANILNPKIMGDSAKIHPVIIVFALIVGEKTAGLIGALFAVPIASVIITVFKYLHAHVAVPSPRSMSTVASSPSLRASQDLASQDLPSGSEAKAETTTK